MSSHTQPHPSAGLRNGLLLGAAILVSVGVAIYVDRTEERASVSIPAPGANGPAAAQELPPGHPPMGGEPAWGGEQQLPPGHPPIDGDPGAMGHHPGSGDMPQGHPPTEAGEGSATVEPGTIPPATGEGAVTVQKLIQEAASFEGKKVRIAAKVLRSTPNVLGKNWLHVGDGTGSPDRGDHDLVVTTQAEVSVGDIVIIEGLVTRNKDLGSGYRYDVLVEEAQITKEPKG